MINKYKFYKKSFKSCTPPVGYEDTVHYAPIGVDGGVFYRTRCLQNETGDKFSKSREIKNDSPSSAYYIFFNTCTNIAFETPYRNTTTRSYRNEYQYSPLEATISNLFSLLGEFFSLLSYR